MSRLAPVTAETLADLGAPCDRCLVWQDGRAADMPAASERKRNWWVQAAPRGATGWIVRADDHVAGHILYAPLETLAPYPLAATPGSVLLVGLRAEDSGVARMLVQRSVRDLRGRGVAALLAVGGHGPGWRCQSPGHPAAVSCRVPGPMLESLGFALVHPHPSLPEYQLDIGRAVPAVDRVLGAVRAVVPRPRGAEPALGRDSLG